MLKLLLHDAFIFMQWVQGAHYNERRFYLCARSVTQSDLRSMRISEHDRQPRDSRSAFCTRRGLLAQFHAIISADEAIQLRGSLFPLTMRTRPQRQITELYWDLSGVY
jgi:hypothetical protein